MNLDVVQEGSNKDPSDKILPAIAVMIKFKVNDEIARQQLVLYIEEETVAKVTSLALAGAACKAVWISCQACMKTSLFESSCLQAVKHIN